MKIVNTATGKAYHLDPDTQLEVERTNPFFNDVGEQTLPVTIPDSDHNRAILDYPDVMANKSKPGQNIDATIQDGEYFSACRQAILGAKRKEGIETTFYMNEGAFFGRIPDTRLSAVFGEETIPGIKTVRQGVEFCRDLLFNGHEIYAIFPILAKGDDSDTTKWLNRVELMRPDTGEYISSPGNTGGFSYLGFVNEYPREEVVDDYPISIPIGCYMTPFVRANYVLRRMFDYFGYMLEKTFFEKTHPFDDMVFLNNTEDTLLNGDIRLTDMIPDMMCSTLLNMYRKRFGCEFIPDEVNKTVKIEFLKDILTDDPAADLSGCVDGELYLTFPGVYKQLKISSKDSISSDNDYDSLAEVVAKFPDAYWQPGIGYYCRRACSVNVSNGTKSTTDEIIASPNLPYYANDNNEDVEIEVPDCAVEMRYPAYKNADGEIIIGPPPGVVLGYYGMFPYIGETQSLNSTIIHHDAEDSSDNDTSVKADNKEQSPMLAFAYFDTAPSNVFCRGTVTNYNSSRRRLFDYSLQYNGEDGIFEQFYRPYDNILRNSFHTVKANLLLSQHQKQNIPSYKKVSIHNQELLVDKLNFTIGGKNEPKESEFRTIRLYEPVDVAKSEIVPVYAGNVRFADLRFNYANITEAEYNSSPYKTASIPIQYLPLFRPDDIDNMGALIWEKKYAIKNGSSFRLCTIWLNEPVFP